MHLKWVELPACPQGKQKTKIEPWTQSKSLCINQRETNKMRKQLGRQRLGGVLPRLLTRPLQVVCRFTIMSAASEMLAFSFAKKIGPHEVALFLSGSVWGLGSRRRFLVFEQENEEFPARAKCPENAHFSM